MKLSALFDEGRRAEVKKAITEGKLELRRKPAMEPLPDRIPEAGTKPDGKFNYGDYFRFGPAIPYAVRDNPEAKISKEEWEKFKAEPHFPGQLKDASAASGYTYIRGDPAAA